MGPSFSQPPPPRQCGIDPGKIESYGDFAFSVVSSRCPCEILSHLSSVAENFGGGRKRKHLPDIYKCVGRATGAHEIGECWPESQE